MHDAAKNLLIANKNNEQYKRQLLKDKFKIDKEKFRATVGYFGHLYKGRGIDIIEGIALLNPDINFSVVGGNNELIIQKKSENKLKNLNCFGYLSVYRI